MIGSFSFGGDARTSSIWVGVVSSMSGSIVIFTPTEVSIFWKAYSNWKCVCCLFWWWVAVCLRWVMSGFQFSFDVKSVQQGFMCISSGIGVLCSWLLCMESCCMS